LPDDDTQLIDIVLAADTERAALMMEAETVHDPDRMAYIYTRLDMM
jgi:ATP-binding cassette subfamily F protein 3